MTNITLIGFGNMGQAFYKGLKKQAHFKLSAYDHTPAKVVRSGCNLANLDNLESCDFLLMAIKPQRFSDFVAPKLSNKTIIISMLSGTTVTELENKFMNNKVVRCMPNLAIQNLNGVTGWYGKNLSAIETQNVNEIFKLLGLSAQVESEAMLDHLTLISGSGPGYLAHIAKLMEQEAVGLGFSTDEAQSLVTQTFTGTTTLLQNQSANSLATQVSCKNGVTEAITKSLEVSQLPTLWHRAIQAGLDKINDLKN